MKKIILSLTTAACLGLIANTGFAQTKSLAQKNEEIIIRRNNDSNVKTTIVIYGNDITVNGQPLADYKGDVKVITRNLMSGNSRNFLYSPRFKFNTDEFNPNRTFLGVLTEKSGKGALIKTVTKGSAAEKAGLKAQDVITKIGDKEITTPEDLASSVRNYKPGNEVKIDYLRSGKKKTTKAVLGKTDRAMTYGFNVDSLFKDGRNFNFETQDFPRLDNLSRSLRFFDGNQPKLGLKIQDLEDGSGVKILQVEEGSAAEKAGIKKDDIITTINGEKINSVADIREKMAMATDKQHYTLKAKRNNTDVNFEVQVPKQLKSADL